MCLCVYVTCLCVYVYVWVYVYVYAYVYVSVYVYVYVYTDIHHVRVCAVGDIEAKILLISEDPHSCALNQRTDA